MWPLENKKLYISFIFTKVHHYAVKLIKIPHLDVLQTTRRPAGTRPFLPRTGKTTKESGRSQNFSDLKESTQAVHYKMAPQCHSDSPARVSQGKRRNPAKEEVLFIMQPATEKWKELGFVEKIKQQSKYLQEATGTTGPKSKFYRPVYISSILKNNCNEYLLWTYKSFPSD